MATDPTGPPSSAPTAGRLRAFGVLRYREYRLFWLGAAFSNLGIWALMSGRLWLMHDLTDSPLMLGLLTVSGMGPILVLSIWGGVIADRVDRLRLVTFTRAMFAVLAFLTGALVALEVIRPWHLIAISLATGVLLSFDIPSRQAIVPNLVSREDLLHAIVMYSFLFSASAVVGPTYFAPLVNLLGLEGLFFFVGFSYVLTVAMLVMMKPMPLARQTERGRLWEDLVGGLDYVRRDRAMVSLIGIGVVTGIFGSGLGTLLPIFADKILDGGIEGYSYLLLGVGTGGLAGTVTLAFAVDLKRSASVQIVTGVGFGLALAVFSQMTWLPLSVFVIILVAGCSSAFGTINNTLLQSVVADDYRGRVMSIHQLGWGASAVGGLLMGFLAQTISAPFALGLGGLVTAVAAGTLTVAAGEGLRARFAEAAR